jgi:hypothetical protein
MKYDLNKLNPSDFEGLVQSLSKRILGNGTISFGEGPDGGREAEFNGSAPFPSDSQNWNGYWVVQAKFKTVSVADENKDFRWVENELKRELEKYKIRKTKVKLPDNYLLFTNIVLTATAGTGGRDRATKLEKELQTTYKIHNIRILSYDDIIDYLDAYRDLATAYLPFILAGDVLSRLLKLLDFQNARALRTKDLLVRFLEYEFCEDTQAKLDHAGKLTSDKVALENVFIDLYATIDGQVNQGRNERRFVQSILQKGNSIIKWNQSSSRYVLIAGPGYGKSTLTQFIIQTYRAFFIADTDKGHTTSDTVNEFVQSFNESMKIEPKWIRLPIKIVLKEFAGWIRDRLQDEANRGTSVLEYIVFNINRKSSGGDITTEELENLLHNLPCIFVFDGLDEVPSSSNRSIVTSELSFFSETILRRIEADAIVIATTRPQGYSKEFDSSKFQHLYITDFEKPDCLNYLDRLLKNLIDNLDERNRKLEIITNALNNLEIGRLMKSPLQASIMAILVKSGGNPPRDKFELFTNYYDTIFKREKQRGISNVLNDRPEYVQDIHNRLGLFLQTASEGSANPSATISRANFTMMVNAYLNEIGLDDENTASLTHDIVSAATDRLVFISEVQDEKFGFAIRSLQEYFAAHGYLRDVKESLIRDYFYAISKSSYWSNTLLFAVGYIAKNKTYLVDSIESICHELNGSTNQRGEKSLTSIVKMGSWLALDIVNEGIFSGKPIIENKFCNLLEPLIFILPNERHQEISKLPTKILEKWIKPILEKSIAGGSPNLTAISVCSQLEKSGSNSLQIILNHWPDNSKDENLLITTLAKSGITSEFIINRFIKKLEALELEPFFNLFDEEENVDFLERVCLSASHSQVSKNVLFELIFLSSLSNHESRSITALLGKLGTDLPHKTQRSLGAIFRNDAENLKVELVDGYNYEITKVKVNGDFFASLRDFAAKNSIKLISAICNFLEEATRERFEELNTIIEFQQYAYKNFIISHIKTLNSFFKTVYKTGSLSAEWRLVLDEIQNCDHSILDTNHKLHFRKYANIHTLSSGSYAKRLDDFIEKYLSSGTNENKIAHNILFKLVDWSFSKLSETERERLLREDRLKLIQNSIWIHSDSEPIYFHNLTSLFYFLSVAEVAKIIRSNVHVLEFDVNILNQFQARINYPQDIFNFTLPKIVDLITLQTIQSEVPSYKLLLQQIIVGQILGYKIDSRIIKIHKNLNTLEKDKYKAALLLLQETFDQSDFLLFTQILADPRIFHEKQYVKVLLYVLQFSPKKLFADEVFKFLDTKITEHAERTELHTQIKNFIGSQKSGVQNLTNPT